MFAKTIVLSDEFLDMPLSARCLYFTLGMLADDEGFVNNPKGIMRQCGASQDDMNILLSKNFVLLFESGVIVIKHWKINNYLRSDRFQNTKYIDEREKLVIKENGAYSFGIPNSGIPSIDKDSIGKDSIDKNKYNVCFEEFWKCYPRKKEKQKAYAQYKARLNCGYSEEELLTACKRYAEECQGREERYIKLGASFLSVNEPFVDYLQKGDKDGDRRTHEERDREIERKISEINFEDKRSILDL